MRSILREVRHRPEGGWETMKIIVNGHHAYGLYFQELPKEERFWITIIVRDEGGDWTFEREWGIPLYHPIIENIMENNTKLWNLTYDSMDCSEGKEYEAITKCSYLGKLANNGFKRNKEEIIWMMHLEKDAILVFVSVNKKNTYKLYTLDSNEENVIFRERSYNDLSDKNRMTLALNWPSSPDIWVHLLHIVQLNDETPGHLLAQKVAPVLALIKCQRWWKKNYYTPGRGGYIRAREHFHGSLCDKHYFKGHCT